MSKQEEVFSHVDVIPEQYRKLTTGGGVEMEKKGEKEKENKSCSEMRRQTGKGQMRLQMNEQIITTEVKDIRFIIAVKV